MSVESELVREIEETLADAEYMAHCGKAVEGLLQRCSLKIEEQVNEIEQLEIEAYGINL